MPEDLRPEERPPRNGERTRLRTLRAAGQLFSSQSPSSIRIDDISYGAKISIS